MNMYSYSFLRPFYRLRTQSERYISRFKALGFEKVYTSVSNLNSFGHIACLLLLIVAIKLGKFDRIKSLASLKKSAYFFFRLVHVIFNTCFLQDIYALFSSFFLPSFSFPYQLKFLIVVYYT
ncbi:MAG: hypothetical protein PWP71_2650 [Clostridia bacterium]|jgi:hypothetical protein|nr:hypothetical protein [Clostridia bacterium]